MSSELRMLHMLSHIQYVVASCHVLVTLDLDCSLHLKYPLIQVIEMFRFGSIQMEPFQSPEMAHSPSYDLFCHNLSWSWKLFAYLLHIFNHRHVIHFEHRVSFVMRRSGASCWSIFHCRHPIVHVITLLYSVTIIHFNKCNLAWLFLINRYDIFIMDCANLLLTWSTMYCTYSSAGSLLNLADLVYVNLLVSWSHNRNPFVWSV